MTVLEQRFMETVPMHLREISSAIKELTEAIKESNQLKKEVMEEMRKPIIKPGA